MNKVKRKIYDIRGKYPTEFDEGLVQLIVKEFISKIKKEKPVLLLGRDVRLSSPDLYRAAKSAAENLLPKVQIIDGGIMTTPMMHFLCNYLGADVGIMITASHNPKNYNGVKVEVREGKNFTPATKDYGALYASFLKNFSDIRRPLKVVIDCSNGTTAPILRELLPRLKKLSVQLINFKPDGNFPAHGPDPSRQFTAKGLRHEIQRTKADLGIMFDADGDRAFFLDDLGERMDPEIIARLLIAYLNPEKIVIDSTVGGLITKEPLPGVKKIFISEVGRSFIFKALLKSKAQLGFERSGHYYFPVALPGGEIYFDSGILTALLIMNAVSLLKRGELSDITMGFSGKYFRLSKSFDGGDFTKAVEKLKRHFKNAKTSNFNGITIRGKGWWLNLRQSLNEPVLRLNIEAESKGLLAEKAHEVSKVLKN